MGFQWDPEKAAANFRKHGILFLQATDVFRQPYVLLADLRRDYGEPRYRAIGVVGSDLLRVVFTLRDGDIRIISAWRAGKNDRARYEKGPRQSGFSEIVGTED